MTKSKHDWRAHLTAGELAELARIERVKPELRNALSKLSWLRNRIQNRATARARLARRTEAAR